MNLFDTGGFLPVFFLDGVQIAWYDFFENYSMPTSRWAYDIARTGRR